MALSALICVICGFFPCDDACVSEMLKGRRDAHHRE
jgi:hypothetical protein